MHLNPDDAIARERALEHQIERCAETAKRAIRAYNKLILRKNVSVGVRRKLERQRKVERAVSQYMQVRREIDELRAKISSDSTRQRTLRR